MATNPTALPAAAAPEEKFALTSSRHFPDWLARAGASLAFTTYQAGKLFLLGLQPDGRLSIFNRTFERCMGLWASAEWLLMSTLYQLWRFDNALAPGQAHQGYDRLYVPQLAWTTGDLDIHDIAVGGAGRPVFVNTLFSCLATVSDSYSFAPLWQPPFITKLAAEDRCHLNGLAMDSGEPRYATSVSVSDVADGWRDQRLKGGVVIDVPSGEVVARHVDAALAAAAPRSPVLARFRQRPLRLDRTGKRPVGRDLLLPGLRPRPCPGRRVRGDRPVAAAAQPKLLRSAAR
jgi:uncharacterized protein (TIGR03032 family)